MTGLSKSRIIMHRQCPKRLLLKIHKPEDEVVDKGMSIGFSTGDSVGDKARQLYPDGVLIDPPSLSEALAQTKVLLKESPKPLFEATFEHQGTLVRADLMLPDDYGWCMVEVKSSTSVKPYHLEDAAVQAYILAQNNVSVNRIEIAHINNQFVYQGDGNYQGLLKHQIETKTVNTLAQQAPDWIAQAQQTVALKKEPAIAVGKQCNEPFACSFRRYCDPQAFEPIAPYMQRKHLMNWGTLVGFHACLKGLMAYQNCVR